MVRTLDRSRLWAVQTPQVFRADVLRRALDVDDAALAAATDDASLVEAAGGHRARGRGAAREPQGHDGGRPGAAPRRCACADRLPRPPAPRRGRLDRASATSPPANAERYREAAAERGIEELGVAEHIHRFVQSLDVWDHPWYRHWAADDVDEYCEFVRGARA